MNAYFYYRNKRGKQLYQFSIESKKTKKKVDISIKDESTYYY